MTETRKPGELCLVQHCAVKSVENTVIYANDRNNITLLKINLIRVQCIIWCVPDIELIELKKKRLFRNEIK